MLHSKSLYSMIPNKSSVSLDQTDLSSPLSGHSSSQLIHWSSMDTHKQHCHIASYNGHKARNDLLGKSTAPLRAKCRTGWQSKHCECFTRYQKLYVRLREWMPKGLRYCGQCQKFTRRKKGQEGRCYHGRPKPRKSTCKFWTHTSRHGAFGRKIWKKWFNNCAMNKMEGRLRRERASAARKGTQRYAMRALRGIDVNTRILRDSRTSYWGQ